MFHLPGRIIAAFRSFFKSLYSAYRYNRLVKEYGYLAAIPTQKLHAIDNGGYLVDMQLATLSARALNGFLIEYLGLPGITYTMEKLSEFLEYKGHQTDMVNIVSIGDGTDAVEQVQDDLDTFKALSNNPHQFTKAQVGLSDVSNYGDADSFFLALVDFAASRGEIDIALFYQRIDSFGATALFNMLKLNSHYEVVN